MFILLSCKTETTSPLVHSLEEFNQAVEQVKPGQTIVLANGIWKDVELVFKGKGSESEPITLTVEEKGKVTLEGQSSLSLGGKYLVVEGLVFKNGFTPASEVIAFRNSKEDLCHNCRVTECVIDNYSNPERFESDYWVGIYGKNNRFDHNYLTGKRNQGVTVAVRLTTEESQQNHHQLDHNYFGHRPILGSNGGETLRIGTSHYSMTNSNTLVEFNYFDRCNGEHEIISNKSCQNTFRNNSFFECQGTLTMRHGNETLVEDNYFFGNRKPNTGGIRIINESQKVINNYCEGLTGYRFRGALVIMNGVPNSPLNRYFQVKDSEASNNTFIDCDYIQFCAGSDKERSAVPENTLVSNNIFYNSKKADIFTIYDDISGITFKNNLLSPNIVPFQEEGLGTKELTFKTNENGVQVPTDDGLGDVGFQNKGERATPENTGVSWYPRREETIVFNTGKVIPVKPGINTLLDAIATSEPGDMLELQEPGEYLMTQSIDLKHPISVVAIQSLNEKPVLKFQRSSLFNIENGGSLLLDGLRISGTEADDKSGNAVIRTSRYSMNRNYKLFIDHCDFEDMDVNHSFNIVKIYKNTFADSIAIRNTSFINITGDVLSLAEETEDLGIYNAENVVLDHCAFKDVQGAALNLYRGGNDESTFGPMLRISDCQFDNIGKGSRNKTRASVSLYGVQEAYINTNVFKDCEPFKIHLVVGDPITKFEDCQFENSGKIISNDDAYEVTNVSYK